MQQKRRWIGIALATLAGAAVPALGMSLVLRAIEWGSDAWVVTAWTFLIALGHMLVLGLPVILWLLRKDKFRLRWVLLTGVVVAALPISVMVLPIAPWSDADDTWSDMLVVMLAFAAVGVMGAGVFYAVARAMGVSTRATAAP